MRENIHMYVRFNGLLVLGWLDPGIFPAIVCSAVTGPVGGEVCTSLVQKKGQVYCKYTLNIMLR